MHAGSNVALSAENDLKPAHPVVNAHYIFMFDVRRSC